MNADAELADVPRLLGAPETLARIGIFYGVK